MMRGTRVGDGTRSCFARFAGREARGTLILAVLAPAILAQGAGSVEGRVTTSTDHAGIAGVTVGAAAQHATTDSSGSFRLAGLEPGSVAVSFVAPGFVAAERTIRLDSTLTAARLDIELVPHSSISGRVLDEDGKPAGGVAVEITQAVRGTGTTWHTWGATADAEGRYQCSGLAPGAYLAMARPEPKVRGGAAWVRTYYPSVADRGQAGKLVLRGGTHLAADIRLLAVPVHAIRGMVYDDDGKPINAKVGLVSSEPLAQPEFQVQARDGAFEFREVPAGDWRVTGEAERAGTRLRGTAPALLGRHDIENVAVRLAAPFRLQAFVEPSGLKDQPTIELYPADAQPQGAAFSQPNPDGSLQFPAVYPGRYQVNVFTKVTDRFLASIRIAGQDVLGKEVLLTGPAEPIHVVFSREAGALRGAVENCAGGTVLLLPQDEGLWNFRFIRRAGCDASGHFEIGGLRPGDYYAMALDRIDSTGLDDLATLRQLAGAGERAHIDARRVAYVELKLSRWPE